MDSSHLLVCSLRDLTYKWDKQSVSLPIAIELQLLYNSFFFFTHTHNPYAIFFINFIVFVNIFCNFPR